MAQHIQYPAVASSSQPDEIIDNVSTNSVVYPVWVSAIAGSMSTANVSSTKLKFNPSTGQFSATSFNALSSKEMKIMINAFEEKALDILDQVEIVTFKYIGEEERESSRVGFLAEDVNSLYLTEDGKHFDINSSISLLIKAVQELKQEIEAIKSSIIDDGR